MVAKIKVAVVLCLIAAITISAAGCVDGVSLTEEGFINRATAAIQEVETYQFTTEMALLLSSEEEDNDITLQYSVEGMVDYVKQEMLLKMSISIPFAGSLQADMYLIDNVLYSKASQLGMPAEWTREEMLLDYWEEQSLLSGETDLLNGSSFEISRFQDKDGVSRYAIDIVPDPNSLWNAILQQSGTLTQTPVGLNLENLETTIAANQLYDKESFLPIETNAQLVMAGNSTDMGFTNQGEEEFNITYGIQMSSNYHSYNEPVDITLPPDGEAAF